MLYESTWHEFRKHTSRIEELKNWIILVINPSPKEYPANSFVSLACNIEMDIQFNQSNEINNPIFHEITHDISLSNFTYFVIC